MRDGLKRILAATTDVQVAGEAASGEEALALVKAQRLRRRDARHVDARALAGIDLIKRLRIEKPKLRILVLSMHGEQQYAARVLKAGAAGYLNKDSAAELLLGALRKIAAGGMHIPRSRRRGAALRRQAAARGALGPRVRGAAPAGEGLGPTEIAERLHLSVKTVSTHKTRILEKLNLGSTAELVRYALEQKLV